MNYEGHLVIGTGSLCAFLLAADDMTPRGIPLFWPLSNVKGSLKPGFLQAPARFLVVIVSALSVVLLVMRLIGLI